MDLEHECEFVPTYVQNAIWNSSGCFNVLHCFNQSIKNVRHRHGLAWGKDQIPPSFLVVKTKAAILQGGPSGKPKKNMESGTPDKHGRHGCPAGG
jgi:hypothetical protein